VSFEVRPGEVVGVVGRNGAGKSTLLKVLSRITEPTEGRAVVRGRLGSLLEVGTGFHPELTGRENVYLNGAILGMRAREIGRKFDEIVAFSEVERFLDTPVKRYSSGMYVRLAFAVAAHLEPEILVVDEVLAVGDASFQRKCLGKMRDVAGAGRTVLFVSHNMTAVQGLCSRAVWLDGGGLAGDGPAREVVPRYLQTACASQTERVWDDPAAAPGNGAFRLRKASVRPAGGAAPGGLITVRTPLVLEFEYWNLQPGARLNLSLHVFNDEGVRLFNTGPVREPLWHGRPFEAGLYRSTCLIPGDLLNDGAHRVQLMAVEDQARVIYNMDGALVFDVADEREATCRYHGDWPGALRPALDWATELLSPGAGGAGR
jgi:lipopolysaccharide transport system ATP-binding protein